MPSIRIPFPFRKHRSAEEAELVLASPDGPAQTLPPPAYDDPRLSAFLRVTFDVLYDWDIQTGAISFSDQIDAMLGLPPGGLPRTLQGWLDRVHPRDQEAAGDALWESVRGHAPFRCEYRLRHEDGSYRTVEDQGIVLDDVQGRAASMIGVMRDVTVERAAQEELARSERALRRQATILDERNAALRVLLQQREQDRRELEQRIVHNVERLIEPTLDRLSRALRRQPERFELDALRANLREIVGPFGRRLAGGAGAQPLTRRETEVANLVRLGKTSDEIAQALHISASSVAFHRANIRRKLGLPKRGPHLATHLAAMGGDERLGGYWFSSSSSS